MPSDTPIDNLRVCKRKDVTHVVTSITYGVDAYFTYTKQAHSTDSFQLVKEQLKVGLLFL